MQVRFDLLVLVRNINLLDDQLGVLNRFFAVLILLPPYLLGPMTPVNSHNIWLIAYAGIPASIITTFLWMRSVRQIGANQASIFINLMPLFSAIIAMIFLGERLAIFHVIGGLLILCGVIMAQTFTLPFKQTLSQRKIRRPQQ